MLSVSTVKCSLPFSFLSVFTWISSKMKAKNKPKILIFLMLLLCIHYTSRKYFCYSCFWLVPYNGVFAYCQKSLGHQHFIIGCLFSWLLASMFRFASFLLYRSLRKTNRVGEPKKHVNKGNFKVKHEGLILTQQSLSIILVKCTRYTYKQAPYTIHFGLGLHM